MKRTLLIVILAAALALTACQSAPPPAAEAPAAEAPAAASPVPPTEAPSPTPLPPPETPEPTAVPPTSTPEASPTPEKLALVPDGFAAWCERSYTDKPANAWSMPADASPFEMVKDMPQLPIPVRSCTFAFTLNQAAPEGLVFSIRDYTGGVWFHKPVKVAGDNPNLVYMPVTHDYFIDPPVWETIYTIDLSQDDSTSLYTSPVRLRDPNMPTWRCVDGKLIDKRTKKCHWDIELHPWDAGYGTPGPNAW